MTLLFFLFSPELRLDLSNLSVSNGSGKKKKKAKKSSKKNGKLSKKGPVYSESDFDRNIDKPKVQIPTGTTTDKKKKKMKKLPPDPETNTHIYSNNENHDSCSTCESSSEESMLNHSGRLSDHR